MRKIHTNRTCRRVRRRRRVPVSLSAFVTRAIPEIPQRSTFKRYESSTFLRVVHSANVFALRFLVFTCARFIRTHIQLVGIVYLLSAVVSDTTTESSDFVHVAFSQYERVLLHSAVVVRKCRPAFPLLFCPTELITILRTRSGTDVG